MYININAEGPLNLLTVEPETPLQTSGWESHNCLFCLP